VRRLRALAVAPAVLLLIAALLAALSGSVTASASLSLEPSPLQLSPCGGTAGYQCGTAPVPVDYRHPSGPKLSLAVIERPAPGPGRAAGTLFLNPGGPGESGVEILPVLAGLLPSSITDHYNLVSFDERGTGASHRLQCGPSPTAAASVAPLPARAGAPLPAARLYAGMAKACATAAPSLAANMSTADSARDMDHIRADLGLNRISYYGLSYGTVLGSVYARMFPTHLHAAVLDGAVVPTLPLATQAKEEAPSVDAALTHWFTTCAATSCVGGASPKALYQQVATRLLRAPLPAPGGGDTTPVSIGDLYSATLLFLTVPSFTTGYPAALQAAAAGNGAPLRSLSLTFEQDIDGSSLVGPEWAIACSDAGQRPSAAKLGALALSLHKKFPLAGAYTATYDAAGCIGWPTATNPVTTLALHSGPRVLVVGNSVDPNTPHVAAVQLAQALHRASLLTWSGYGHTWLLNGAHDTCMADAVTAYLQTAQPPPSGTTCR
jgi:pimeloyl-ACP methyl ester carboxylesterase